MTLTAVERVKALPRPVLLELLAELTTWRDKARAEQLPPEGEWRTWYVRGGRGSGKTWTGGNTLAEMAEQYPGEYGVVAPTDSAVRDVCIEGPSGIIHALGTTLAEIKRGASEKVASYNQSSAILRLRNGSVIYADGADDGAPTIQGKNLRGLWADEVGLWRKWQQAWEESIRYAVRLSPARIVATGTPKRGHPLVRMLMADDTVNKTLLKTSDNAANLDPHLLAELYEKFGGTTLGRQELEGEILDDVPGALWQRNRIDRSRVGSQPVLDRIVVAIDPSATSTESADEAGIVVAGIGTAMGPGGITKHGYVLADETLRGSPATWARVAIDAYHAHNADRIVAEVNNGGEMVEYVIHSIDPTVPFTAVTASRGKVTRAEPISALYEQGRIHHVGAFELMEDQMCVAGGTRVDTARGWLPIERVVVGDEVWTRQGWKPVTWAGPTGYAQTMTISASGRVLRCTPGHPLFVEGRGFVPAREVQTADIILGCHVLPSALASSYMARSTIGTTTGITSRVGLAGVASSIAMFGRRLTDRSRRVTMSIISTMTGATTPSITSMLSVGVTTSGRTASPERGLSRPLSSRSNAAPSGPPGGRISSPVAGAGSSTSPSASERRSARARVASVTQPSGRPEFVYNLTVADAPEFYAEGLLVHNCSWVPGEKSPDRMDALVWALTHLMVTSDNPWAALAGKSAGGVS